jgi:hypothetical protein
MVIPPVLLVEAAAILEGFEIIILELATQSHRKDFVPNLYLFATTDNVPLLVDQFVGIEPFSKE